MACGVLRRPPLPRPRAYRSTWEGRPVAVELARDPLPDEAFEAMEKGLALIDEEQVHLALQPPVLAAFRQWMRLGDLLERERSYLEALMAVSGRTLVQY